MFVLVSGVCKVGEEVIIKVAIGDIRGNEKVHKTNGKYCITFCVVNSGQNSDYVFIHILFAQSYSVKLVLCTSSSLIVTK